MPKPYDFKTKTDRGSHFFIAAKFDRGGIGSVWSKIPLRFAKVSAFAYAMPENHVSDFRK